MCSSVETNCSLIIIYPLLQKSFRPLKIPGIPQYWYYDKFTRIPILEVFGYIIPKLISPSVFSAIIFFSIFIFRIIWRLEGSRVSVSSFLPKIHRIKSPKTHCSKKVQKYTHVFAFSGTVFVSGSKKIYGSLMRPLRITELLP